MKNEINMGSSIIDFYMEGYSEGKDDDVTKTETRRTKKNRKSTQVTMHSKNKKAFYKAKSRMAQLNSVAHYVPSPEDKQVVQGMLKNHQLPMDDRKCENPCGSSIGNKRRIDTANQKMREALLGGTDEPVVLSHGCDLTDHPFELHGFSHEHA